MTDSIEAEQATAPAPSRSKAKLKRLVFHVLITIACLGMAYLQLWRAETKDARYQQQQAAEALSAVVVNASQNTPAEADALQWHPVTAIGTWIPESTIYLDNKVYRQRVGYQAITALKLSADDAVILVNRGWVAASRLRSELPNVPTPEGPIAVKGIARKFDESVFEFGHPVPEGRVWQHVRKPAYESATGRQVLPFVVLQTDATNTNSAASADGLVRDWAEVKPPENPAFKHIGYAIMWALFALIAVAQYLISRKNA